MSEQDLLTPLHQFHDFTRELLSLARAGDWPAFERKAPEREALMAPINDNEYLVAVARAGLAEPVREEIARIQALNDEITALAEDAKASIADDLKARQRQKKAINAYKC